MLATNKESPCKVTKTQHSHKIKKKKTKKLKSWIHQEYTLRHRSACRTPAAESGQESLTSVKNIQTHAKLGRMKEPEGETGVLVGLDWPLVGGGIEAGV